MKVYCAILGFQIDRESCGASGNHPACRKCMGSEKEEGPHPAGTEKRAKEKV